LLKLLSAETRRPAERSICLQMDYSAAREGSLNLPIYDTFGKVLSFSPAIGNEKMRREPSLARNNGSGLKHRLALQWLLNGSYCGTFVVRLC